MSALREGSRRKENSQKSRGGGLPLQFSGRSCWAPGSATTLSQHHPLSPQTLCVRVLSRLRPGTHAHREGPLPPTHVRILKLLSRSGTSVCLCRTEKCPVASAVWPALSQCYRSALAAFLLSTPFLRNMSYLHCYTGVIAAAEGKCLKRANYLEHRA